MKTFLKVVLILVAVSVIVNIVKQTGLLDLEKGIDFGSFDA